MPPFHRHHEFEVEDIGSVTVVRFTFKKWLDDPSPGPMRDALVRLVDEFGRRQLLLNFEDVEFMTSALLGTFITLHRKLQAVQGKLAFCNIAKDILDVFRITRLDRILTVVINPKQASLNDLIREAFGNPYRHLTFSPEWRTNTVLALAKQMYELREFSAMPILADAFQDAGCDNIEILDLCRGPEHNNRGCWVVDLVLGKE